MPPQWDDALLRLTLRRGAVYYLQHRRLTSPAPHYFVVVDHNPAGDEVLVLLVASSKVEDVKRRRQGLPAATLVEISPARYGEFSVPSIIDCNTWFSVSRGELLQKLQQGLAVEKAPMPEIVVAALRQGLLASPLVEEAVKMRVRRHE